MSAQWHMLHDGQQYGPYTGEQLVEFVKEGRIARESLLWAEGMAEWVRADAVEGLFPAVPAPAPVLVSAAGHAPVAAAPPWSPHGRAQLGGAMGAAAGMRPGMVASPYAAPGMAASPYAAPGMLGLMKVAPGEDYPAVEVKSTMYGLMVAMMGGGLALVLLAAFMMPQVAKQQGNGGAILLLIMLVAGYIGILIASILNLITLSRAWSCLQHSTPRTTPGKAVGFLFIPFFNLYWLFQAYYGLAKDWNRIMSQHPNLARMPRISEGLALTYCIGMFIPLLSLICWFPLMSQITTAINAMAYRPVHHPGTMFIR
jgi:hypothetical protein